MDNYNLGMLLMAVSLILFAIGMILAAHTKTKVKKEKEQQYKSVIIDEATYKKMFDEKWNN